MVNMLSVDKYLKKAKVSIIKGNISEAEAFYKLILQNYPENKERKKVQQKLMMIIDIIITELKKILAI